MTENPCRLKKMHISTEGFYYNASIYIENYYLHHSVCSDITDTRMHLE